MPMKNFLSNDFLLYTETSRRLYHDYAAKMPIIDYHNHLPPDQIALDHQFSNLTQAWLYGDHYKWRAMRTNGVAEAYCTGSAGDYEKFKQWAATVPFTIRNPLYHWTHLELRRYFDVHELLTPHTANAIYTNCSEQLNTREFSVKQLLSKVNVKVLCTTDDPVDDLNWHKMILDDPFGVTVKPAFRPDKAMQVDDAAAFNEYVSKLEAVSGKSISSYNDYLTALKSRHDFFAEMGCCVSDHGLEYLFFTDYTEADLKKAFEALRSGKLPSPEERMMLKSALLEIFATWDHEKNWVQQFHVGALRNNNSRMLKTLGRDTGWDSIGDFPQASGIAAFLDRLDQQDKLARTIIYNLNPADNAMMATMTGNFNDGTIAGKVQWGSGWWFLDQKDGMTDQLNTLSNMGLISRFIGMLTDSRSFLSFPRHEYFRRILCNLFGEEMEKGELPGDIPWIGTVIQDICYNNVKNYFGW
jgi:glucuronate isomerase